METYDDWPTVVANLRKARRKWTRMSRILGQADADARTSGTFFKVVVQSILLFSSETWVVTTASAVHWRDSTIGHPVG